MTRVAVLLATYNGEKYLPDFLDSLVRQSNRNFRLIVRDDGSTDKSLHILEEYCDRLDISIIKGDERLGAAKNFMRLLAESGSDFDYYFFADQDDFWSPEKIQRALSMFPQHWDQPVLYCAGLELVNEDLSHILFTPPPKYIGLRNALVENIATGCTMVLNGSARRLAISNMPEDILMHDWWIYIICSALGSVIYDDYPSLKYRQHGNNAVGSARNAVDDFLIKLKRFFSKGKSGIFGISHQAKVFEYCYGSMISKSDNELVADLMHSKNSILWRLNLALFSPFLRQRYIDTIILKILFLLGRY